jgi:phosphoribosylformimino-5-aminoimidazole carboxamide ribotide isomerase
METATAFEILPAIDLRGGHVVRLEEGDFERETSFSDDASAVATKFADDGARWIHLVDLDAARGREPHTAVVIALVAAVRTRLSVEVAGGLRSEEGVARALSAGAARAVLGTAAIRDHGFAGRMVSVHGPERITVAIDVRGGRAVGNAWSVADDGVDAPEAIRRLADQGVKTFEVTAIDRDGLLTGPDLDLYERLVGLDRGDIIASGGIARTEDIAALRNAGCAGAIIGRALYEGSLTVPDALEASVR